MWRNIFLNNVDLTTLPGVQITKLDASRRADRVVMRKKLARADGLRTVDTQYAGKPITIAGVVKGSTRGEFEDNLVNLMKYLEPANATLEIPQGDEQRKYDSVTVDDVSWSDDQMGSFALFTCNIVSSKPYGESVGYITAVNSTGITVTPSTKTFTNSIQGSFDVDPLISFTLTSYSSANSLDYVKITNPATGQYIKVSRAWLAGDILVIDCNAKTVLVNGATVDYSGVFPTFSPGQMYVKVEDSFTVSRSSGIRVEYKKREY